MRPAVNPIFLKTPIDPLNSEDAESVLRFLKKYQQSNFLPERPRGSSPRSDYYLDASKRIWIARWNLPHRQFLSIRASRSPFSLCRNHLL
jgi:hypothetical protein